MTDPKNSRMAVQITQLCLQIAIVLRCRKLFNDQHHIPHSQFNLLNILSGGVILNTCLFVQSAKRRRISEILSLQSLLSPIYTTFLWCLLRNKIFSLFKITTGSILNTFAAEM